MSNWKADRIGSALRGENPTVLARMRSGCAVLGDPQFLPGYCVLLGYPQVASLNDLDVPDRQEFLIDMTLLGDAIAAVCSPLRMNYDILGNTDAYLHAHVFPRYAWEAEERRKLPVWLYPRENWTLEEHQFNEARHGAMKAELTSVLQGLMETSYR